MMILLSYLESKGLFHLDSMHSLHLRFPCLWWQIPELKYSLHWLHTLLCSHVVSPPLSFHLLFLRLTRLLVADAGAKALLALAPHAIKLAYQGWSSA